MNLYSFQVKLRGNIKEQGFAKFKRKTFSFQTLYNCQTRSCFPGGNQIQDNVKKIL